MKSWLLKFKVSNALNEKRPLSPELEQAIASSDETRRFAESSAKQDRDFRKQVPQCEAPQSLHGSIMRAVRNERRNRVAHPVLFPRWVAASSFVCAVMLAFLTAVHFSTTTPVNMSEQDARVFNTANSMLEIGGKMLRNAPDATISPLQDEMKKLDKDLDSTREFLVASLP